MNTLFPLDPVYPAGFQYREDFISEAEEQDLLKVISKLCLQTFQFQGYEAKRRVASFGCDWSFDKQQLSKGKDIPVAFQWIIDRVAHAFSVPATDFAELLITEYPASSVINWHRDAPPFAIIAGVSLNQDCMFRLRPYEKEKQGRKATISITVKRRSLYLMESEAREEWQHSITAVEGVRYSITLRTLKESYKSCL